MNKFHIFYLNSESPRINAQQHCDQHVISKLDEYAIHLSTAHRLLDGKVFQGRSTHGEKVTYFFMQDPHLNRSLYKVKHSMHPSSIWTRSSYENYTWLYDCWVSLAEEYTYRFGDIHTTYQSMHYHLLVPPEKIESNGFSEPNSIDECRRNYLENKNRTVWTRRFNPEWIWGMGDKNEQGKQATTSTSE